MKKYIIEIKPQQKKFYKIYMELSIYQQPIRFEAQLLDWSNEKQKLVPLKESVLAKFLEQGKYDEVNKRCSAVVKKFIAYLTNTVQTPQDLDIFIKKLRPTYIFHHKLIEVFQISNLKKIMDTHFKCYPILNTKDFSNFLPHYVDGWFIADLMEVSAGDNGVYLCDMQSNTPQKLTPDEVMQRLNLQKTDTDSILQLCTKKWIDNCGVSLSTRTLYWDIALAVCKDPEIFKHYILSYEYGKESLEYDISPSSDLTFYEAIKNQELQDLTQKEIEIFMSGYNFLMEAL